MELTLSAEHPHIFGRARGRDADTKPQRQLVESKNGRVHLLYDLEVTYILVSVMFSNF